MSERYEHRHAQTVHAVIVAQQLSQIALFELDGHEDVAGCHEREQEVRSRHGRCAPEREQKAKVQRMADQPVGTRVAKADVSVRTADELQPHLPQAEEVEVIDDERRGQDGQPT